MLRAVPGKLTRIKPHKKGSAKGMGAAEGLVGEAKIFQNSVRASHQRRASLSTLPHAHLTVHVVT